MGTIIVCLLTLAIALLLYTIVQGKKEKNNPLKTEDPLAGLPDIIGRPKGNNVYSSPAEPVESNTEMQAVQTPSMKKGNEGLPQVTEIPKEGPDTLENALPDWKEEEEEMGRYAANGPEEGFATGVTFDELASFGKMLERPALEPAEEQTAAGIVSKIDGTELLKLLDSKFGDTSKKIAMLLDRSIDAQPDKGSSNLQNDNEEGFNIGDYV